MSERIRKGIINAYGFGELGFIIMMTLATTYYSYFLTDVAYIGAAAMGTILLVARIVDAISVPIAGAIIEKSNMKWGKYRSWILASPPFILLFFILMFTNLNISPVAKAIYLGGSYIIAHVCVNLGYTSYLSLIPILGTEPKDRLLLASRRGQANAAGKIIFSVIAMPMIIFLGGGNEGRGFFITTIIFTSLMLIGFYIVANISKDFDTSRDTNTKKEKLSTNEMISQVFINKPLLILMFTEITRWTSMFTLYGLAAYYFRYVVDNMLMISVFFTSVNIAMLVGTTVAAPLAQKIGKRNTYLCGLGILLLSLVLAWLIANNAMTFIVLMTIGYFGFAFGNNLNAAMYSDAVDYGEWKTGKNARGFIMSMFSLPIKIGIAIGGAAVGYGLAAIGYMADSVATTQLVGSINMLITLLPAFFVALGIIGMFFYKLNNENIIQMQLEIQQRKASENPVN
ncbi:sugar (Glycoside-Pentoside-Hexuronide) transporter [Alkaliphilus metalliredigens QYMF]|uniref:Sugar (Glycoside-Pentoside-Hexuronide) transporter n=1 Tax=Alkaliphilus metalliredigens (strain QYMF) TaxID=293826 RepID=A6TPY1_ALKMQ|nr:MFS transporter [Alkaliphilus metalliredigens]ABR48249.1 sugar (Glycoside-Pentoside-Hexuronide) transporter [Alkaliphilus metalliredigens QYMF]